MIKRTVTLIAVLLAFSAPAALADSGRLHDRIERGPEAHAV